MLGDTAEVCVIDLQEQTIQPVYVTKCWGFQTGSNCQWGAVDHHLYANDIFDGRAVCVRIDLATGEVRRYGGPLYSIAPDESAAVAFPLELMDITQRGYGAPAADPEHPRQLPPGASATEGIWPTDLKTGEARLLVSLAEAASHVPEPPPNRGGRSISGMRNTTARARASCRCWRSPCSPVVLAIAIPWCSPTTAPAAIFGMRPERRCGAPTAGIPTGIPMVST